jgi:acetoacetate decarboxylase
MLGITPLSAPAFPAVQPRFFDREYLNIVYRTDPEALRAVVPAPLEIDEPLVRFEVMKMNDVTGYGPYTEAGQAIPVVFDGERGEYLHAMYLDSFAATASGREVGAYPKVMGSPRLYADNGALVGTLDYGTLRVATATSNMMIGITAAASAVIYIIHGGIDPYVAGPTAIGVFIGATAWSRLSDRADLRHLQLLFVIVLVYTAVQLLIRVFT